jgi:hypothetical protein
MLYIHYNGWSGTDRTGESGGLAREFVVWGLTGFLGLVDLGEVRRGAGLVKARPFFVARAGEIRGFFAPLRMTSPFMAALFCKRTSS